MKSNMKNRKNYLMIFLLVFISSNICTFSFSNRVMANPHYDRAMTVAGDEYAVSAFSSSAETKEAKNNIVEKAWKKINGICYNGSGEKIPGAITRGIDVSEWQDIINWKKVKSAGIDFAFVRIAYGLNYMDKTFDYNMKQAELAGVPVGTYIYSTALSEATALKEAQLAIKKMKGYKVSYPVVFDMEYSGASKLSPGKISKMAHAFCDEVRKAGYYPMVYCNTYWYDTYVDWSLLSGIDVWIARYGDTIQAPDKSRYSYTVWQSTDGNTENGLKSTRGLIPGIQPNNDVDINFGYIDYTKKITPRWKPVASYVPSSKPDIGSQKAKTGWVTENGDTLYYINNRLTKGWKTIKGHNYYFDIKTGALWKNRLLTENGLVYYLNKKGYTVSSQFINYNGKTYYIGKDGYALKGLKKINGNYYYFSFRKSYMCKNTKIIRSNGDIYFAGKDGACYKNGIYKIKENGVIHTYYFQKNAKAYKGWLTVKGKKFYFYKGNSQKSGTRAENITLTNARKIASVFDKKGVCIKQTKIK